MAERLKSTLNNYNLVFSKGIMNISKLRTLPRALLFLFCENKNNNALGSDFKVNTNVRYFGNT